MNHHSQWLTVNEAMQSKDVLQQAKKFLGRDLFLDAELLLAHVLGCKRIDVLTKDYSLNQDTLNRYMFCIEERKEGKPLQYIINKCEFMGLDFYVDENVLIPRSDTEVLVEKALEILKACEAADAHRPYKILELCTGSGCIAISLAYYMAFKKDAVQLTAVDISEKALAVAKRNTQDHDIHDIQFVQGDMFESLVQRTAENVSQNKPRFDMLIANPPYIPARDIPGLEKNVREYEPHLALDGGESGLDFYYIIAKNAAEYLQEDGIILLEIGYDQAQAVQLIFQEVFESCLHMEVVKDLSGLDRVLVFYRRKDAL